MTEHVSPNYEELTPLNDAKRDIYDYIKLRLGDGLIDVELEKVNFDMAIKQALIRYRQKANASVEESYLFLPLAPETQEYILPREVQTVRQIFRRGTGGLAGGASQFEPFSSGFLNTYMLVAGRVGGLTNYELFTSYQKLTMQMFGGFINFTFNAATKKLTLVRNIPFEGESVLLWAYITKPDQVLLNDPLIMPWIQDYAYSMSKHMLGEAREKFSNLPGPSGGVTLNGTALKAEAKAEMDELIVQLGKFVDNSAPLTWVLG